MSRRLLLILIVAVTALGFVLPASAQSTSSRVGFRLDCSGFVGASGSLSLTRDNTRQNREAFIISATDGAGNVIFEPLQDSFFVGGSVSWAGVEKIRWTTTPLYNPLVLRIVSRAGNGFPEKLLAISVGRCDGLPSFDVSPEGAFFIEDDLVIGPKPPLAAGETSPTVPLNRTPPRQTNPAEVTDLLPGVAIVNTDNLYLRSGDGPEYTVVGIVDGGTRLITLGRNADFSWWYVQAGEIVGWAKKDFLILRGNFTGVPVVPSMGVIAQPRLFIFIDQQLFATPSDRALPICTIPGQLEYLVVGRDQPITWYQVQALCDGALVKGWIKAELGAIRNPAAQFIPVTTR